ncbi:MAG TPA: DinB family protein [Ktedonobacteraceae bacterium]|nr:DinB family protein [Ktedonobacteraceae bacterium]
MNAKDILKYGQPAVLSTLEGFPESAWETPGACGVWSVKDIIAHLASYEQVLVDILAGFVSRQQAPSLDRFIELGSQFNDTEVERRKTRTMREVLDEFNDAHAQVMSLVGKIAPETLRQPGTLPWYGMDYSLDDVIVYMYYGHKREHSAQIAAFRDRLDSLSKE